MEPLSLLPSRSQLLRMAQRVRKVPSGENHGLSDGVPERVHHVVVRSVGEDHHLGLEIAQQGMIRRQEQFIGLIHHANRDRTGDFVPVGLQFLDWDAISALFSQGLKQRDSICLRFNTKKPYSGPSCEVS